MWVRVRERRAVGAPVRVSRTLNPLVLVVAPALAHRP